MMLCTGVFIAISNFPNADDEDQTGEENLSVSDVCCCECGYDDKLSLQSIPLSQRT
jgi:Zn ribbon nucleic-acid-binding protein